MRSAKRPTPRTLTPIINATTITITNAAMPAVYEHNSISSYQANVAGHIIYPYQLLQTPIYTTFQCANTLFHSQHWWQLANTQHIQSDYLLPSHYYPRLGRLVNDQISMEFELCISRKQNPNPYPIGGDTCCSRIYCERGVTQVCTLIINSIIVMMSISFV